MSLLLLFGGALDTDNTLTVTTGVVVLGSPTTVTATLMDEDGLPLSGKTIYFRVTGANSASGSDTTDMNGEATFQYTPTSVGTDTIRAQWGAATGLNLISIDESTDRFYRHDGFSASVLDDFARPGSDLIQDVAHDGDNLIVATSSGGANGTVYRMVGISATIDTSLTGLNGLVAVAWDGTHLLTAYSNGDVKMHDGFSTTVISTTNIGTATSIKGIAWIDGDLVAARLDGVGPTNTVEQYDGFSSSLVTTLNLTGLTDLIQGLSWTGDNLITVEDETGGAGPDRIHIHDGFSATITQTIASPSSQVRGAVWSMGMEAETSVSVSVYGSGYIGRRTARLVP